jgi:WD40 repeat protein
MGYLGGLLARRPAASVRLWNTATGALQRAIEGHLNSVVSVAFSPDGRLLASGSYDETVRVFQTIRLWDTATGALNENVTVDGVVTDLKFSQDSSYLTTNLGSLDIQSRCGNNTSNLPQANLGVYIQRREWITMNGERLLWLPPESRPSCSAIKDSTIALGHASERISFIGVRV